LIAVCRYAPDFYYSNSVGYFNSSGELLEWHRGFTYPDGSFLITPDGELYVVGNIHGFLSVKKLGTNGRFLWESKFEMKQNYGIVHVGYDACSGHLFASLTHIGWTSGSKQGSLISIVDSAGNLVFHRYSDKNNKVYAIKVEEGNIVLIDDQGEHHYQKSIEGQPLSFSDLPSVISRPVYKLAYDCTSGFLAIIDSNMTLHLLENARKVPYLAINLKDMGLIDGTFLKKFYINDAGHVVIASGRLQKTIYVK
jgi:hypothetical protein